LIGFAHFYKKLNNFPLNQLVDFYKICALAPNQWKI